MPLSPAYRLGPYEVVELLSAGTMGEVYRARDTRLGRHVAVKILPAAFAADADRVHRFEQEAQAAGALNHPNIVAVFDVGRHEGTFFVVSELIEGTTLRERVRQGRLSRAVALDYGAQIGRGLAAAHERGIVHRDLKPENVMITRDGRVKIVDFGIAKVDRVLTPAPDGATSAWPGRTQPGTIVGTIAYMSPEQIRGQAVDHRTDVFSLGVMLYEMLAGRHPFGQPTPAETISAILRDDPSPLDDVPDELDRAVRRALEKNREARFASALDLALTLESLARTAPPTRIERPRVADTAAPRTIAVLPFTNVGPDSANEYFSDGLTEEIIHALTRVRELQVVAWHTAAQMKGRAADAQAIGADLHVATVLVGSVRTAGNHVRIGARLLEVGTGYYLWSETYDRELQDVFAIQEEIASAIVGTLTPALIRAGRPVVAARTSVNVHAHDQYLQGRYLWNRRTADGLRRSVGCFERAIEADPGFALAHSGLADAWCLLADYGLVRPAEAMPKARTAALRALELDSRSAEAHASFAFIRSMYDWEWTEAEAFYRRAIELGPGYATAHHWLAVDFLAVLGRFDEATVEADIARQLDPLSLIIHEGRAYLFTLARRYDEAIGAFQSVAELDPSFSQTYTSMGRAYAQKQMYGEAIALLEKGRALAGEAPRILGALGQTYALAGRRTDAEGLLEELKAMAPARHVPSTCFALIHTGLGQHQAALDWLELGCAQHELALAALYVHPAYDALRDEPRFKALLKRMRFPGHV